MHDIVRFEKVTKRFERTTALQSISFAIAPARIVGLVGANGSGKSTLLRHVTGVYLPTEGECFTMGVPARRLESAELARIGVVNQREDFLTWMCVAELLSYVAAFYPKWDLSMQNRLTTHFELAGDARIATLSPGNKQRLAIVLATCHHPELLLLDEPLSDLDPLAREKILQMLLEIFRDDGPTIVVSSHLLHDIERIIDHVVCLDAGKLLLDEPLDKMHERFAEWTVTATNGHLPARFAEPWIISQSGDGVRRQLAVSDGTQLERFRSTHAVTIESRPMNLERVFTHLVGALRNDPGNGTRVGNTVSPRAVT